MVENSLIHELRDNELGSFYSPLKNSAHDALIDSIKLKKKPEAKPKYELLKNVS